MQLLSELLDPAQIRLHEDFGLPSLGREAVYFALMGHEALHGRPNTIATCTGATHAVVMGKIVPDKNYRALCARVLVGVVRLLTLLLTGERRIPADEEKNWIV